MSQRRGWRLLVQDVIRRQDRRDSQPSCHCAFAKVNYDTPMQLRHEIEVTQFVVYQQAVDIYPFLTDFRSESANFFPQHLWVNMAVRLRLRNGDVRVDLNVITKK